MSINVKGWKFASTVKCKCPVEDHKLKISRTHRALRDKIYETDNSRKLEEYVIFCAIYSSQNVKAKILYAQYIGPA